jgi:NAD-dependent deacetylase
VATETAAATERIAGWLRGAGSVVVLTGAGISTESGIPDFRGPEGLWTKNPEAERAATIQHYVADPAVRIRSWRSRIDGDMWAKEPNEGHRALVDLEQKGRLDTLITQNVDSLHHKAGTSPDRLIEIHGTMRDYECLDCGDRGPIEAVLERVRAGEDDPACRQCGGILKSATISFGQNLVPADLDRAQDAAERCDVFLAVGTSLTVYPVAYLPEQALRGGARLVILNGEETPFDRAADAVVRERIGAVLPAIVAQV